MHRSALTLLLCSLLALLAWPGCGSPPPPKPPTKKNETIEPPRGKLPESVVPKRYTLELTVDPRQDSFSGKVSIEVGVLAAVQRVWLHGMFDEISGNVETSQGTIVGFKAHQHRPDGVLRLDLDKPLDTGAATIHFEFKSKFGSHLAGLYKVESGGEAYAFTQMEPVWARQALPCFDEPRFKTPFDVTLIVPKEHEAIANTGAREEKIEGAMKRVRYRMTELLPTYLLAWAVGPLDIVEAKPIPESGVRTNTLELRGVTAKGRGKEIAYALENTGPMLLELERYFGIAYPYDKLDIIAVPDKGGAMENPGAITFREWLLLFDPKTAPIQQKRAYAYVMAHELAHQWFGNLVTMPWWDDIWLNEAFATWMGFRVVQNLWPDNQADVAQLRGVHGAMAVDSLMSARQIRQPVVDNDDIHNAFDRITYRKGGGVLAMFERWMGADAFRNGLQHYMARHRHRNATASDLMSALTSAAGKDVSKPFESFLMQAGLPLVDVDVDCEGEKPKLVLSQSRYLPVGSKGNAQQTWQIPVCVRYADGFQPSEQCTLLTEAKQTLELEAKSCPNWVMPNAGASGYYQWQLSPEWLVKLTRSGMRQLSVREKMSLTSSLRAATASNALAAADALELMAPLARDSHPAVATGPMGMLRLARWWLFGDPLQAKVEAYGRRLYQPARLRLGNKGRAGESAEAKLMRRELLAFLGQSAGDEKLVEKSHELAKAYIGFGGDGALHRDAIDPDLATVVMANAGPKVDAAMFDALLKQLDATRDDEVRRNLLAALGNVRAAGLPERALALTLDPRLKVIEAMGPLWNQLGHSETRVAAWDWFRGHIDPLIARLSPRRAGWMPEVMTVFCDVTRANEAEQLFMPRIAALAGGPRNLKVALERTLLCAARRDAQLESVKSFFDRGE
jgi:alanyl aminopeptidase